MAPEDAGAPGLNREAAVEAALDMLEAAGIDGLSMRALADRLGVKAASLYWHLRDKQQLLDFMVESVLGGVEVPAVAGWRAQVTAACDRLAGRLEQRPATALLLLGSLTAVRRSSLVREIARALASAGLDDATEAAFALVVETAAASGVARPMVTPPSGSPMTLEVDSGSWRATVRAAPPGATEVAAATRGASAAVELRAGGHVVVRSHQGGGRGAVELSRDHVWFVKVHGGTWNTTLDLTGLHVSGVEMDSGGGNVTCLLPAPVGVVPVRLNSGIIRVNLLRPRNAAASATVMTGSARVRLDGHAVRVASSDVAWQSAGVRDADDRYELTVCSGCVQVTMDASLPAAAPPPAARAAAPEVVPPGADGSRAAVTLLLDGIEHRLTRPA